jgi:AraC family transcriptional regulator of arabinose operon
MKNIFLPNISTEHQLPLKVIAVGENENQLIVERRKGYPAYHCMLCKSGNGHLIVDDCHYDVEPDSVFFLNFNQPHSYYADDSDWHTCWVVFEGENALQILKQIGIGESKPKKISKMSSAYMIFNLICSEALSGGISSIYKCSAQLYALLLNLSYSSFRYDTFSNDLSSERIEQVLKYIETNWQKNIGLDEMASLMKITPQYFCKLFKDAIGKTPYEYLITYRLQKSKEIMADKKLLISEVSNRAGFNDTSYFCAVFKKYEGITPKQFREIFY